VELLTNHVAKSAIAAEGFLGSTVALSRPWETINTLHCYFGAFALSRWTRAPNGIGGLPAKFPAEFENHDIVYH